MIPTYLLKKQVEKRRKPLSELNTLLKHINVLAGLGNISPKALAGYALDIIANEDHDYNAAICAKILNMADLLELQICHHLTKHRT